MQILYLQRSVDPSCLCFVLMWFTINFAFKTRSAKKLFADSLINTEWLFLATKLNIYKKCQTWSLEKYKITSSQIPPKSRQLFYDWKKKIKIVWTQHLSYTYKYILFRHLALNTCLNYIWMINHAIQRGYKSI